MTKSSTEMNIKKPIKNFKDGLKFLVSTIATVGGAYLTKDDPLMLNILSAWATGMLGYLYINDKIRIHNLNHG